MFRISIKGTFLSRRKGDIFIEGRHESHPRFNPRFVRVARVSAQSEKVPVDGIEDRWHGRRSERAGRRGYCRALAAPPGGAPEIVFER